MIGKTYLPNVILAVPSLLARITPFSSIVATELLDELLSILASSKYLLIYISFLLPFGSTNLVSILTDSLIFKWSLASFDSYWLSFGLTKSTI